MADISDWSPVDESNNQPPPSGWPEGMAPSAVNNSARALMGGVRRWYDTITAQVVDIYGRLNTYLPLSGGTITGNLTVEGALFVDDAISTTGPNAAYSFDDRTGTSGDWILYSTGGIARLWNAGDKVTIDTGGTVTAALDINAGRHAGITGTLFAGSADISGNLAAAGTVSGNAIHSTGQISAVGTITGNTITATGTVSGGAIYSSGQITAVGTIAGNTITATGTVSGNAVYSSGNITAVGTITCNILSVSGSVTCGAVGAASLYATNGVDGHHVQARGNLTCLGDFTSNAGYSNINAIQPRADHDGFVGKAGLSYDSMSCYNYITVSDARLKRDIEEPEGCLDLVRAVPPRTYRWADRPDQRQHWGLLAQDFGDFPGRLVDPETGQERLALNQLLTLLWGATRELAARLEALEETARAR